MKNVNKKDIKSLYLDELKREFGNFGQPSYKAEQVYKWLHNKGASSFFEMTDISKKGQLFLDENYDIMSATVEKKLMSEQDNTVKYLFKFSDNSLIESVLMEYNHGYCICVSTQAGCKMGCRFCATGKEIFLRNLKASEMLVQIHQVQKDLGIRISNVVLMGMGEPLDNYDNVVRFLKLVTSKEGLNIGMRHISVSTCGITDKIYKLADLKLQITLALSLHAPNDEIRNKIMPISRKYKLQELIESCKYYSEKSNRRICFEYVMIKDLNDSESCAYQLAELLKGTLCYVNLIPLNAIQEFNYKKSTMENIKKFAGILKSKGITCTIRRTLGSDINASCGQLRRGHKKGDE